MLNKTKKHLWKLYEEKEEKGEDYHWFPTHIPEVERWAQQLLEKYPEADEDVVLLSVYLHDIGQLTEGLETDHAASSEKEVRRFLPTVCTDKELVNKVARCVRAHRNADVKPESLEEKILVVADSLSHMTDVIYLDISMRGRRKEAVEKLERDIRDADLLPGMRKEVDDLYEAWKGLLEVYPDR